MRLAAEAFSYLTLRGIAGEPLKVVLLGDPSIARQATAAVALERLAYLVGTTIIVGVGSILAMTGSPLTPVWFRVFRAFAITAGVIALLTGDRHCRAAAPTCSRGSTRIDRLLGTSLVDADGFRDSSPRSSGRSSSWCAAIPRASRFCSSRQSRAYVCMALEAG